MKSAGLGSREELRDLPELPGGRWIVSSEDEPLEEEVDPLLCAAILGMSGPSFYSPERPVVWTRGRLGRTIRLRRLGGFYED